MRTTLMFTFLLTTICLSAQQNSAFTATISHSTEDGLCEDGMIDLELNEGLGPYEFEWTYSNGTSSGIQINLDQEDLFNLRPYQYCVVVTDALCGKASACFDLECCPSPPEGVVTDFCSEDHPGAIYFDLENSAYNQIILTNAEGFYAAGRNFTMLDAGYYTVEFLSDEGCRVLREYYVHDNSFRIDAVNIENIDECWGGHACRGSIDIEVVDTRSQVTYEWYSNDRRKVLSRNQDIDGLCEGTYFVAVTSDEGCTITREFEICCCTDVDWDGVDLQVAPGDCYQSRPERINIGIVEILNESATGAMNGSIDIVVTGGTGNYTFEWVDQGGSPVSNQFPRYTEDIDGLTEGMYCVTVGDGCDYQQRCVEVRKLECDDILECQEGRGLLLFEQINVIDAGVQLASASNGPDRGMIEATIFSLNYPLSIQLIDQSGEVQSWTREQYGKWTGQVYPGAYCLVVTDGFGCEIKKHLVVDQCTGAGIDVDLDFENASPFHAEDPGFVSVSIRGGAYPYHIEYGYYTFTSSDVPGGYFLLGEQMANSGHFEATLSPCDEPVDNYVLKIRDSEGNCHWEIFEPPCECVESYFPDLDWKVVNPCFNNGLFSPQTKVKLSVPFANAGNVGGLGNHTYTILWPDGKKSAFVTEQVTDGNGGVDIEYSIEGPDQYIVSDQEPFSILIFTEFGCFLERRYHLFEPTDGQTFNTEYLNHFIGPVSIDAYHFVTTGCEINNTCGYEAVLINGEFIYPPRIFYNYKNFEQFEYAPPSSVDPCKGGGAIFSSVCDLEIPIPESFNGTELIDYSQEPLTDENGCYYPCGCLFSNSYVSAYGIENDVLVMTKKYVTCDDPVTPGDCQEVNIISYDLDHCSFTFECLPSGNIYTEPTPTSQCLYTEDDGTCSWVDYCPGSGQIINTIQTNVDCNNPDDTPCFTNVTRLLSDDPVIETRNAPQPDYGEGKMTDGEGKLKIYPNPFTGKLNIDLADLDIEDGQVQIFNSMGELVFAQQIGKRGAEQVCFNEDGRQGSGMYTVIVFHHEEDKVYVKRAVCIH